MSEISGRVLVSKAEGRGGKAYWIREAVALAGEVAALKAKLVAMEQVKEMLRAGASVIKQGAHLNDDWVRESEDALIATAQEEKE